MSTREQALSLVERLNENDLQMFLSLFGRLYQTEAAEQKSEESESMRAFQELETMISSIPRIDVDEDAARDEYFKEKYGL